MIRPLFLAVCLGSLPLPATAGLLFDWVPTSDHIAAQKLTAATGPAGTLSDPPAFDTENHLEFDGAQHVEFPAESAARIPTTHFSVEAEVRIDRPQRWGSIIASSQDNGSYERGWLLGYNNDRFTFKISTGGALVDSPSPKPFSPGQWAHLVGVYDGNSARLYIDGALVSTVPAPGAVARPDIPTPFVIGAYKDADEFYPMHGRVRRIRIHDAALPAAEITKLGPRPYPFAVRPSVRFLSPDSAEVLWESSAPGRGIVVFGTTSKLGQTVESDSDATSHRATITGLLPGTVYHYRIASRTKDGLLSGKVHTFDTALNEIPVDLSTVIPPTTNKAIANYAAQTVGKAGFERGFCLVLGLTDGHLLRELARVSGLTIIGVDSDPTRVARIRQSLHAENLYGPRISITAVADLENLPFTSCLANLIVSEQTLAGQRIATPPAEIHRLLRPGGLSQLAVNATATRRPKLAGSGDWSHQYADPANSANTHDKLGGASSTTDYSLQWIGRPGADFGIDRNPRMPAPLAVNGRLFHQGMDRMVALDAYNGQTLWAIEAPDLRRLNMPHDCGNWCADDDNLFVAIGDRAWSLDAATGKRTATFPLTAGQRGTHDWGFIACTGDLLIGSSVPAGAQFKDFWGKAMWFDKAGDPTATAVVCSDNVFAYAKGDATGLWAYGRGLIVNSTITVADDRIWFVESRPPESGRPTEGRVTGRALWQHAHVVCLDSRTGAVVWEQSLDALSDPQAVAHLQHQKSFVQVAYGAHTKKGFLLLLSVGGPADDGRYSYIHFDGDDGDLTWHQTTKWNSNHHGSHMAHPVVLDDRIYVEPGGVQLADGSVLDHTFGPREGCATVVASENSLFFRGINRCLTQWSFDSRTPSKWSRVRPSCWINMLPSQGLMLIPEGGGGCSCGGWMETSMGLIPNTLLTK